MRAVAGIFLAMLLSGQALAGPQYTAEDVIRYFEQNRATANTASRSAAPAAIAPTPAPAPEQATAPATEPTTGQDRGGEIANARDDAPLAIPMTGVKAGYRVAPPERVVPHAGLDLLVTFDLESAMLTPQARENLDAFARALRSPELAGLHFAVEGYTDSSGSPEYNQRLSEARAAAVVTYLTGHGVASDRLIATGYGETRPRLPDPADPGNRRVETRPIR